MADPNRAKIVTKYVHPCHDLVCSMDLAYRILDSLILLVPQQSIIVIVYYAACYTVVVNKLITKITTIISKTNNKCVARSLFVIMKSANFPPVSKVT